MFKFIVDIQHQKLIRNYLATLLGGSFDIVSIKSLHGGSINQVHRLELNSKINKDKNLTNLVVKVNSYKPPGFFEKEFIGLQSLAKMIDKKQLNIRVPNPLGVLTITDPCPTQFLIMEYITPGEKIYSDEKWKDFGVNLALLHQYSSDDRINSGKKVYGWEENTYIGNMIQFNTLTDNWVDFFRKHRLLPQLNWAKDSLPTDVIKRLEKIINRLEDYIPRHPPPALLHGDLWTGNFFFSHNQQPVIYDPAVYYGHHETDLAMTTLFGSFPPAFYTGYQSIFSVDRELNLRGTLYNLYHLLNHYNLFGKSYLSSVESSLKVLTKNLT